MLKPIAFLTVFLAASAAFASEVVLSVGQVSVLRPGAKVSTVIVGDPTVIDVVVEGESTVLLLARKAGQSDVVLLDEQRDTLETARVVVAKTHINDHVTIHRSDKTGVMREELLCATGLPCEKADKAP